MRFYDFDKVQLDRFVHTALFVMLVMAVLATVLVLIFDESFASATKFPEAWLISIVFAAFLFEVFYTCLALLQFQNRRKEFLITQVVQAVLSMVFTVAFLLSGWDWRGVVIGRMMGMAIAIAFSLRSLGYELPSLLRIPRRSFYRNIRLIWSVCTGPQAQS